MRPISRLFILFLILLLPLFWAQQQSAAADDDCTDLLFNGDMENVNGWTFPSNRGEYTTDYFLSPDHSAHLGTVGGGTTYSSMRQDVIVPAGEQLVLKWHMYPQSEPFDGGDGQLASILGANGTQLRLLWRTVRDDRDWVVCSYNVSEFLDQEIKINFTVINNSQNGLTELWLDDVSLQSCSVPQTTIEGCLLPTPSPTPVQTLPPTNTPTWTPTATPSPTKTPTVPTTDTPTPTPSSTPVPSPTDTTTPTATGIPTNTPTSTSTPLPTKTPSPTVTATPEIVCRQFIANPEFDQGGGYDGWAQNLFLTTAFTDLGGISREGAWFGGSDFADHFLYQDINIPADAEAAHLDYGWALNPPTLTTPLSSSDALTITVRRPLDDAVLETLQVIGDSSDRRLWRNFQADLAAYIGQDIRLHFQATTAATTTSWHIDGVTLGTCAIDHKIYLPLILFP